MFRRLSEFDTWTAKKEYNNRVHVLFAVLTSYGLSPAPYLKKKDQSSYWNTILERPAHAISVIVCALVRVVHILCRCWRPNSFRSDEEERRGFQNRSDHNTRSIHTSDYFAFAFRYQFSNGIVSNSVLRSTASLYVRSLSAKLSCARIVSRYTREISSVRTGQIHRRTGRKVKAARFSRPVEAQTSEVPSCS